MQKTFSDYSALSLEQLFNEITALKESIPTMQQDVQEQEKTLSFMQNDLYSANISLENLLKTFNKKVNGEI